MSCRKASHHRSICSILIVLCEVVANSICALEWVSEIFQHCKRLPLTSSTCFFTSGSLLARLNNSIPSSVSSAFSGSAADTRRKFELDIGSMIVWYICRRISSYLSRMLSSTLPSAMPIKQSASPPTSTIPPVIPRPPHGLHT